MKKKLFLMTTSAAVLAGSMALADAFSDAVIANLQSEGFTGIEVKNGISQTKVEAVRGTDKLEVVYDRATGAILKQEWETAEPDDLFEGVEVRTRFRDFLDDEDIEDEEDDDDDDDDDGDDDDEDEDDDDDDDDDEDDDDDGEDADDGEDEGDDEGEDEGDDDDDDD